MGSDWPSAVNRLRTTCGRRHVAHRLQAGAIVGLVLALAPKDLREYQISDALGMARECHRGSICRTRDGSETSPRDLGATP